MSGVLERVDRFGWINTSASLGYGGSLVLAAFTGGASLVAIPLIGAVAAVASACKGYRKSAAVHTIITLVSLPFSGPIMGLFQSRVPKEKKSFSCSEISREKDVCPTGELRDTICFTSHECTRSLTHHERWNPVLKSEACRDELRGIKRGEVDPFSPRVCDYDELYEAASHGDLETIKASIARSPFIAKLEDEHGDTFLMISAKEGHLPLVQFLCEETFVEREEKNHEGLTALDFAGIYKHKEVFRFLTRYHSLMRQSKLNPLAVAIRNGWDDLAITLVEEGKIEASFYSPPLGNALTAALRNGRTEIAHFLMTRMHQNDLSVRDSANDNMTPAMYLWASNRFYSEENQRELQTLFQQFNEKDRFDAEQYLAWKGIGAVFGLSGQIYLDEGVSMPIEGSVLRYYFADRMGESLQAFNSIIARAFKRYMDEPRILYERWQRNELILFPGGFSGHHTTSIMYQDTIVFCDLDPTDHQRPYEAFAFNTTMFTLAHLESLYNPQENLLDIGFFKSRKERYTQVKVRLKRELFSQRAVERRIEGIDHELQQVGNCAYLPLKASVKAAFFLLGEDEIVQFQKWVDSFERETIVAHHNFLQRLRSSPYQEWQWKIDINIVQAIRKLWQRYALLDLYKK